MLGRYGLYEHDIMTIKKLGDNILKVTQMSACRIAGLELYDDTKKKSNKKNCVNEKKLMNNLIRAKTKVNELAICNPWEYFVTLTINKEKYDRYNLKKYYTDFSEFIHNINKRREAESKIKYLLIPEKHNDGAYHMHGLIYGISMDELYINSNGYLSWKKYEEKFGYIGISIIEDKQKTASYITKYISKELGENVNELGCHLYYCSKGLKTSEIIYHGKGELLCGWDYVHPDGYCKIKTFDTRKEDITEYVNLL